MKYRPLLATLTIIFCSLIIALILVMGLIPVVEFLILIVGGLVASIFGVFWWGFKDKIVDKKESNEFYSPIHNMIVRANTNFSRKVALRSSGGAWVSMKQMGIDCKKISETFEQNSTKFKDEDLKKWAELEKEITRPINGGGFFLGRDVQEWFDDLESRYDD